MIRYNIISYDFKQYCVIPHNSIIKKKIIRYDFNIVWYKGLQKGGSHKGDSMSRWEIKK